MKLFATEDASTIVESRYSLVNFFYYPVGYGFGNRLPRCCVEEVFVLLGVLVHLGGNYFCFRKKYGFNLLALRTGSEMESVLSEQDIILSVNRDIVRMLATVNSVLRRYKEGATIGDGVKVIGTEVFRAVIKGKLRKMSEESYIASNKTVLEKLCRDKMIRAFKEVAESDIWSESFENTAR